jgi:hypothetical protein
MWVARRCWAPGDDRGAVTVEAALALCSLMVVLALALGAVASVGAQLRCMDAAREAARLVARGQPERARQAAVSIAPAGASVEVVVRGDEVTATVSSRIVGRLSGLAVSGRAVGVLEPGLLDTQAPALGTSAADVPDPGTSGPEMLDPDMSDPDMSGPGAFDAEVGPAAGAGPAGAGGSVTSGGPATRHGTR